MNRRTHKGTICMIAGLLLLGLASGPKARAQSQPYYRIVPISIPGVYRLSLWAVNDTGHAAGCMQTTSTSLMRAIIYFNGNITDLGAEDDSCAFAINNNGEVAGIRGLAANGHLFAWSSSAGFADLGLPPTVSDPTYGLYGFSYIWAARSNVFINDSGQIVGNYDKALSPSGYVVDTYLWSPGSSTDLSIGTFADLAPLATQPGTVLDSLTVGGINDSGQVAGSALLSSPAPYICPTCSVYDGQFAVVMSPGTSTPTTFITALYGCGNVNGSGLSLTAKGINDSGEVVGEESGTCGANEVQFAWTPTEGLSTGTPGAYYGQYAIAVTNDGKFLNLMDHPSSFIYTNNFIEMPDLKTIYYLTSLIRSDCGWTTMVPEAMSKVNGNILGLGNLGWFLMTPLASQPASYAEGCTASSAPALALSPSSLDFGHSPVGVQTLSQSVTVTNSGTASLNISSVTPSGDYLESDNCTSAPIAAGNFCTISASFLPTATGTRPGTLSITDDATGSPQTVSLTGIGDPAATSLAINAPSITYGANGVVTVTVTSAANTVTGNVSLIVDGGAPIVQALTGGSSVFTITSPTAGDHSLSASFAAQGNLGASSNTGALHVAKAPSTTTFTTTAPAQLAYNGAYNVVAHTTGDGVLTLGASGACSILANIVTITAGSGTCTVTANTAEGTNYLGSSATPQIITAIKATATVTLGNLTQIYTGGALSPTATTNPGGLTIVWTNAPQTNVGSYPVTASVNDPNYQGSASGTFNIQYGFSGLFSPYAPPSAGVAFKDGSAIPLMWQYTNAGGAVVASPNAAPSVQIYAMGACGGADATVITVNDTGNSGYQYDPTTNTWQFNWKTTGLPIGCYDIYIQSGQSGQTTGGFPIQLK